MTEQKTNILQDNEDKQVFTDKKDFPLSTLKEMFDDGDIIPQPDYQRDYVYDDKLASRLVESVLMSIPIPTIYFCEEEDGTYSIIDGQQRITSLVRYLKNEFALRGLQELPEFNKKKFQELDKDIQRKLKSSTLATIILLKSSQELKYEIFARLNQGAVKLNPQELRNCIYRGSFNNMLNDIAENNKLLPLLFLSENKRKSYQENILRFFALRNFNDYGSSLKQTMNNYMSTHQNDDENNITYLKKQFNSVIDIIKQVFGDTAFCAYDRQNNKFMNTFSGSVYDSIVIPCSMFDSHDLIVHADEIRKKVNDLKIQDSDYQDYTYAATGSKNRVVGRIMIVYNLLKDIIGKASSGDVQRNFGDDVKNMLWHEGYVCSFCNQEILSIDDAEVDHSLPYSKGGETIISNAQLLHRHCNRVKNNKYDEDLFEDEESE